jgi:hypothetical protein
MTTHQHEQPDLARAWWTWCCPTCHPQQYAHLTKPDPEPQTRQECPFCLRRINYRTGRYSHHQDDNEPCRGSGLNQRTAGDILRGILAERTQNTPTPSTVTRSRHA